ncbi:MAG: bifunctional diaminohydroxyphosphoribosylaminopyrimidine deaminase/5-amino-6-(5-phosphoribosylamino)uracil reductase RibD [Pseudomonadota bacterium]
MGDAQVDKSNRTHPGRQSDTHALESAAFDASMMRAAIELARRGEGGVSPNPLVGAIIVKNGDVIGEGWHKRAGSAHAEVNAIKAAGESARGATIYVSLEPCAHHGRTPPCVDAILSAGITRVVYGLSDPNKLAAGGAEILRDAGLRVDGPVCEHEARALNRFWLGALKRQRPYVVAKFATSLDGKIATRTGDSKWITGDAARARGHDLRQACDAIIVGAGTIIADDPALTARPKFNEGDERTPAHPLRVVMDSTARTPPGAAAFDRAGPGALLATTARAPRKAMAQFQEMGVEVALLDQDTEGRIDPHALLEHLYQNGVQSVLLEGGAGVLGSFFDAGLVDEVWAFLAPVLIGGNGAPSPISGIGPDALTGAVRLSAINTETLGPDLLVRGEVMRPGGAECSRG